MRISLKDINELIIKDGQTGKGKRIPCESSFSIECDTLIKDDFDKQMPLFVGDNLKIKAPTVNPYKVAKKTGKSVEDIVAKDQKKKEKSASALARKERHKRENKVEISSNNMRVSAPRPISEAGSTYKRPKVDTQGKKNTNPKNQSGKQKNKNNKKK